MILDPPPFCCGPGPQAELGREQDGESGGGGLPNMADVCVREGWEWCLVWREGGVGEMMVLERQPALYE